MKLALCLTMTACALSPTTENTRSTRTGDVGEVWTIAVDSPDLLEPAAEAMSDWMGKVACGNGFTVSQAPSSNAIRIRWEESSPYPGFTAWTVVDEIHVVRNPPPGTLLGILKHELGHAMGLEHSNGGIMKASNGGNVVTPLDVQAYNDIWCN